jgi:hypothetical protein
MRRELLGRVRARQDELERVIFARLRADVFGSAGSDDPRYLAGLEVAVGAVVEHSLAGLEWDDGLGEVPAEAIVQAHRAARAGVALETVLRRYVLGASVMSDFLAQEAEHADFAGHGVVLREALGVLGVVLDRLIEVVTREYRNALAERSPAQRRAKRVLRLLAGGDLAGVGELGYELRAWHVGVIACGKGAEEALRGLAGSMDRRLLAVARGEDVMWGWLGGGAPVALGELEACVRELVGECSWTVGEPAHGFDGWRLTHRQARAALCVASRSGEPLTRYGDVALVASMLCDEALAHSLVEICLGPLGSGEGEGGVLRETLRAYFMANRNASSAASVLGVTRHTVEKRVRVLEERLGLALRTRQAELEVALRLEGLMGVGDHKGETGHSK